MRNEVIHVISKDDSPMCSRISESQCAIMLHCPSDETGLQYAYQFAHEFCHWLIGGTLSGECVGLFWLEETICELASFHCLSVLRGKWSQFAPEYPLYLVDDYIFHTLEDGLPPAQLPLSGYINSHRGELYTPEYHRDLYSQMALALYPHFRGCPQLWQLLPYFGDLKTHDRIDRWLEDMGHRTPTELQPLVQAWSELLLGSPQLHSQK